MTPETEYALRPLDSANSYAALAPKKTAGKKSRPIVQILGICLFTICLFIHEDVSVAAYFILCVWTLFGPKHAVRALSLNYIILLLNPAIVHLPSTVSLLRWLLLLVASIRILPTMPFKFVRSLVPFVLFYIVVLILSWLISPLFEISLLKVTIFTVCAMTALVAFNALNYHELVEMRQWFVSLTTAIVLLSLPTILLPKIGFFINGSGFQGIFNHPQAFGVFLAPIVAYIAARIFLSKAEENFWILALAGLTAIFILLSKARTAVLSIILSLLLTSLIGSLLIRKASGLSFWATVWKIGAASTAAMILMAASGDFSAYMTQFWTKSSGNESLEKSFYESRGGGMEFQWKRFLQKPLTGQGFGIDVAHARDE